MISKSLLILIVFYIFLSCNARSIRQARLNKNVDSQSKNTQIDSFLYYQPVNLRDNFLDSLKSQFDKQVTVKVRILPPPQPAPAMFKKVEGFRVQIFAGLDSLNALSIVSEIKSFVKDSVYFFKDNGLHKIQLGDYLYRNDADNKIYDLRKNNINTGWVVQRMINIPNDIADPDSLSMPGKGVTEKLFTIQILATADLQKAQTTVDQLKTQFKMESSFIKSGSLYKVFLGSFETRENTEEILQKVRENGFADAWLVQK